MIPSTSEANVDQLDEREYLRGTALGLSKEALELSNQASRNATLFKVIKDMADIFIIVGGIVVAISNFVGCGLPCVYGIVAAIAGILVSSIKTFSMVFYVETRGSTCKEVSARLKHLSRKARSLAITGEAVSNSVMRRKIEKLCGHLDEYDLTLYDPKNNPGNNGTLDSPDEESPAPNREKSVTVVIPRNISPVLPRRAGSLGRQVSVASKPPVKAMRITERDDAEDE